MAAEGVATRDERGEQVVSHRVLTVPNALSFLRLLGVPLFVWLILAHHDVWGIVLLTASGVTDYLDGKIARHYGLVTRLGQLLDPAADRLYTLAIIVTFAVRGLIPWWLLVLLLARDAFMAGLILALKRVGVTGLPVHFVGKAATFNLLWAFPILLAGQLPGAVGAVMLPIGWALTWWGVGLYLLAAGLYAVQASTVFRRHRAIAASAASTAPVRPA